MGRTLRPVGRALEVPGSGFSKRILAGQREGTGERSGCAARSSLQPDRSLGRGSGGVCLHWLVWWGLVLRGWAVRLWQVWLTCCASQQTVLAWLGWSAVVYRSVVVICWKLAGGWWSGPPSLQFSLQIPLLNKDPWKLSRSQSDYLKKSGIEK